MRIPTTIAKFWSEFTTSAGSDVTARFYEAFHFDDNECGRIGRTFSPDMPVVCERFKVVYTASRQHAA
jgi:hypothetical protein